jgi:hypothetical protein
MNESIYEQLRQQEAFVIKRLEASKGKLPEIAEGSGVPYRTLEKIARRDIKNPGIGHIDRLFRYFRDQEASA